MSYAVLPSMGGLAYNLERPYMVDQLMEGLSESPKFMARTAVGDDSVCHSVQTEEEVSSCSSLHQQALVGCLWRMMLLLALTISLLIQKETNQNC